MFGQELLDVTYRDGDKIIQDKIRAPVRLTGVLLYAKAVPENGQTFMKDDVIIILEEMPAASL